MASFISGEYVFSVLPTEYGKSLHCSRWIKKSCGYTLVALMKYQTSIFLNRVIMMCITPKAIEVETNPEYA